MYRAVIFDLGGVVFPSPFAAWRAHEAANGLPHGFISRVIVDGGEHGAWSRFERGELGPDAFAVVFAEECVAAGHPVDVVAVMAAMTSGVGADGEAGTHAVVVDAIRALRASGLATAALTNNFADADGGTHVSGGSDLARLLGDLFDVVVESAVVGLRKPDPRVYELVCDRLGVAPTEAVFLDDLGVNCKAARALGMATIKVTDPHAAVAELAGIVGLDLGVPA